MKILQICAYGSPTPGNFISCLETLENSLKERNIGTVYAFPEKAREKEWCKKICERTKVYFLPEAKARILPQTYSQIKKIYEENDIGIVHSHFELYDIPATVTAPKNVKVFWHLHDPKKLGYQSASAAKKLLTRLQYGFFGRKATLLSVSEEHMDFVISLGFRKENTVYFPNGIDTGRIKTDSVFSKENNFLMFGWDYHRKGVDLAVEAMKLVQPSDAKVFVVGEELCKTNLEGCDHPGVYFKEKSSDVNRLYSGSKAFLHISRAEGLSYALLEAIYYGLPVICSDIPENKVAEEFRGVIFTKNENIQDIANAIKTVSETDGLITEDIAYNRHVIEDKYSLTSWCKKLVDFYLE